MSRRGIGLKHLHFERGNLQITPDFLQVRWKTADDLGGIGPRRLHGTGCVETRPPQRHTYEKSRCNVGQRCPTRFG
jgi:hypothetical protein